MVRAFALFLVLATMTLSLNAKEAENAPAAALPAENVDPVKAKGVPVVLRVKLIKSAGVLEKYGTDEVEVIAVLKNDTQEKPAGKMGITVRNIGPFVPKGESTIYCRDGILQDSSHTVK